MAWNELCSGSIYNFTNYATVGPPLRCIHSVMIAYHQLALYVYKWTQVETVVKTVHYLDNINHNTLNVFMPEL